MELTRREFLEYGAAAGAFAFFFGASPVRADGEGGAAGAPASGKRGPGLAHDRILVILQLSGGNDGLSTVVPYGDAAYAGARSTTRIAEGEVLKIDKYVGLHPRLGGFRKLYDEGKLAIVQGVGYPNPNRSHFKSMDIWHAADARGRSARYGWVGRLADDAFRGSEDPEIVIHIGNRVPFALEGIHRPIAFTAPQAYRWIGAQSEAEALERAAPICECEDKGSDPSCETHAGESRSGAGAGNGGAAAPASGGGPETGRDAALGRLRKVLHEAQESSEKVRAAARDYRPRVVYPNSPLAGSLATVAALIAGRIGTRIYSVETGGFDTHQGQRNRHDRLMQQVDGAVTAFYRDLEAMKVSDRVTVIAFSEFGRRVRENGSQGTDHGVAGPMFVIGGKVKGGLHGKHPSLTDLDNGDLRHTTDFREVYTSVIEDWVSADANAVLGGAYKKLPLIG